MAGSGKSAVGEVVAEMLGWQFVDLDKLILQTQNMSHDDYMKTHGEAGLAVLEEQLTLNLDLQDTVYSPPGSIIYHNKGMEKIKKESIVVYLKTEPEIIEKRLGENLYKNGIIGLKEKGLAKLMAERAVYYEKYADYTFYSGDQSKQEMAKKVIDGLIKAGIHLNYAIS